MAIEFIADRHARSEPGALGFTITDPDVSISGYVFVDLFLRGGDYAAPRAGVSLRFVALQVEEHQLGQPTATVTFFPDEPEPSAPGVPFTSFGEPGRLVPEFSDRVAAAPDPVPALVAYLVTTLAAQVLTDRRVAEFSYHTAVALVADAEYDCAQVETRQKQLHEVHQRARADRDIALALWRHIGDDAE
ncbi:hypothetical protein ACFYXQ_15650 [Nocardia jiangxiensis]|uniref:Uncharacterized protein n=1 Tax=Nocardia jiangxiensis TaxID=282685 RepID=A0ABW6RYV6_9NOCA